MSGNISGGNYYIDAISRWKKRDVVMLSFIPLTDAAGRPNWINPEELDQLESRCEIITWLKERSIDFCPCGEFWNGKSFLSYPGHLYVDVIPFKDLQFFELEKLLLSKKTKSLIETDLRLWVIKYSDASENSHHDAIDYQWD